MNNSRPSCLKFAVLFVPLCLLTLLTACSTAPAPRGSESSAQDQEKLLQEKEHTKQAEYKTEQERQKTEQERQRELQEAQKAQQEKLVTASMTEGTITNCECIGSQPHIYSIGAGLGSIVTFQKGRSISIPIEGKDFRCNDVRLLFDVTGTVPIQPDDWDRDKPDDDRARRLDAEDIVLKPGYVNLLTNGDRITVYAVLTKLTNIVINGVITTSNIYTITASHTFTLYDVDYYRKNIIPNKVPLYDLTAFPLPEAEAKYLFGPLIGETYYVVKLSIRNTTGTDKLISSGMIVATGNAVVYTNQFPRRLSIKNLNLGKFKIHPESLFTVPVAVSPQSLNHIYSILNDEEPNEIRPMFFRDLEFAGALASGAAAAFGGPPDLLKGITLFSGVFVPETKKLWPDRWPGYKLNLVNFGMPDLLKVPKGSVSGHKYLFFPKSDLETIISDQTLMIVDYDTINRSAIRQVLLPTPDRAKPISLKSPHVNVISLAFDSLEVPFENVNSPSQTDVQSRIAAAQSKLSKLRDRLQALKDFEKSGQNLYFKLSLKEETLTALQTSNNHLKTALDGSSNLDTNFMQAVTNLANLLTIFSTREYLADLINDPNNKPYGLNAVQSQLQAIDYINRQLAGGRDPSELEDNLQAVEKVAKEATVAFNFYDQAADLLQQADFKNALDKAAGTTTWTPAISQPIVSPILALRDTRDSVKVAVEFYPEALNPPATK